MGLPIALAELRAMLAQRAEPLCRALLSRGSRQGDAWHSGPPDGGAASNLCVTLTGERAGCWRELGALGARGDALALIARIKTRGDSQRAVRWARRWLGIDGLHASASRAPPADPSPHLQPGYLERAGARVRALGTRGDDLFVEDPSGRRYAICFWTLRWRRTFAELFRGDPIGLAGLFPPTEQRQRAAGWDLHSAQECLIAQCAHVGLVDPARLGATIWKDRRKAGPA